MNSIVLPPPYPLDAFHFATREAALEVIRHVQAPDALIGMAFLTTMSAALQGLFDLRLPTGQLRPLSLNLLMIGESGERKSGVDELVSEPIFVFDELRMKKYDVDIAEYKLKMGVWKSVERGFHRQIAKTTLDGLPIDESCRRLAEHAARKPIEPRSRRIMRQNSTQRATMDALAGDGESIAFMSDDGEIIIKGGALNLTGALNKMWDGAKMLTLDRSDGVSVVVRNPRVTVAYMVQPRVLKELLDRRGDVIRGSGHWARYLIGCPVSTQGSRFAYNLNTTWTHLPKFHEVTREFLNEFGRQSDADAIKRTVLEFSDDAVVRWITLTNQTESMLRPLGYLHDINDFASKAVEIAGRVAALFHVFSKQEGKISVDTLNRAVTIVEWHLHEFKRLFSPECTVPPVQIDAQLIERYLCAHYWQNGFSVAPKNDVLKNGPVRPSQRFEAALEYLCAMNRVRISVDNKRKRYINLHSPYFGGLNSMVLSI